MSSGHDPVESFPAGTQALVGYYHYDGSADQWHWSEEIYLIHGYQPGEVELTPELLMEHKHPEDRDRAVHEIMAALRRLEPFSSYHRIVDRSGMTHRVVAVGGGAIDEHGALAAIDGYVIDLTPEVNRETHIAADRAVSAATAHRAAIEQAKGIIMGTFAIDPDSSFAMLRWVSQRYNVKISLLAERLVAAISAANSGDQESQLRLDRLMHEIASRPDEAEG